MPRKSSGSFTRPQLWLTLGESIWLYKSKLISFTTSGDHMRIWSFYWKKGGRTYAAYDML